MAKETSHRIGIQDFSTAQITMIASSSADEKKIFQTIDIIKKEISFIVRTKLIYDTYCNTIEEAIEIYNRS
jgi:hypothetical protein